MKKIFLLLFFFITPTIFAESNFHPQQISRQVDFCGNYSEYFKFQNNFSVNAYYLDNTTFNMRSNFVLLTELQPGESQIFTNQYESSNGAAKAGIITKGYLSSHLEILCGISFSCKKSTLFPGKYEYVISLAGNPTACSFGPGSGAQDDPYVIILNEKSNGHSA